MATLPPTYKVKSFVVEARYPPRFKINSSVWEILDEFPSEAIGFLNSGGVEGRDSKKFFQYQVEFNRASFLVENVDNAEGLQIWIAKAAGLLNHVINKWNIGTIDRLGIRFHLLINSDAITDQAAYAKMIGDGLDLIKSGGINSTVQTGGFVFRFQQDPWHIRFGGFSSDFEVVKKYHKYNNPDSIFSKAGILYDTDCFQFKVDSAPNKHINGKFDVSAYLHGAHKLAADLAHKHLNTLNGKL